MVRPKTREHFRYLETNNLYISTHSDSGKFWICWLFCTKLWIPLLLSLVSKKWKEKLGAPLIYSPVARCNVLGVWSLDYSRGENIILCHIRMESIHFTALLNLCDLVRAIVDCSSQSSILRILVISYPYLFRRELFDYFPPFRNIFYLLHYPF